MQVGAVIRVDPLVAWGMVGRLGPWWCHLFADEPAELDELHRIAKAVGMRREWFQTPDTLPHYDLVPKRRAAALRAGAVEGTREELVTARRIHMWHNRGRTGTVITAWVPDGNLGMRARFIYANAEGERVEVPLHVIRKDSTHFRPMYGRKPLPECATLRDAQAKLREVCESFDPKDPNTQDGR